MKKIFLFIFCVLSLLIVHNELAAKKLTRPTERAVYHNNRGVKFLDSGQLNLAELEFKTAAELSPDYTEAYNNLGVIAKLRGDLAGAKTYLEKAISLDKTYGSAYSHLSMVYMDMGDLKKALEYGKIALNRGSTLPITHFNIALVYLEKNKEDPKKNYDQYAEKELKIATELNPDMFDAHITLARLYKRQARYELSSIRYRLALTNHPGDTKVWNELGEVYQAMGDNIRATNAFKMAKSIASGTPDTTPPASGANHLQMGLELLGKKEYPKAIEALNKAVKAEPKNARAHYLLGTAYLNHSDAMAAKKAEADNLLKSAIPALKTAISLDPQLADASYNLGLVYFKLGNSADAKSEWDRTLSINSGHTRALYNLGMLYNQEGNAQKATEYLCRFTAIAGNEFATEREKALNIVKGNGGICQN